MKVLIIALAFISALFALTAPNSSSKDGYKSTAVDKTKDDQLKWSCQTCSSSFKLLVIHIKLYIQDGFLNHQLHHKIIIFVILYFNIVVILMYP